MNIKERSKKWKTDTCLLYRVNECGTEFLILYVYGTLEVLDKQRSMDKIEYIKEEYVTWSTGPLEDFIGCMI